MLLFVDGAAAFGLDSEDPGFFSDPIPDFGID
jgi:hypothetical protein